MIPVVIPSYEPGDALIDYCRELKAAGAEKILVVDDGSGAAYCRIFDAVRQIDGCTVYTHPVNMGKGRALKSAFTWLFEHEPSVLGCVTADSDGQHLVRDVIRCIRAFEEHPDSLVLGVRDFSDPDILPIRRLGNRILVRGYRVFRNIRLQDTQTGLRVYPASYMKLCLGVKGERYDFENRALIAAFEQGVPVVEQPIKTVYAPKEDYVSHYRIVRDNAIIYMIVMGEAIRYALASFASFLLDILLFRLLLPVLEPVTGVWYIFTATLAARMVSSVFNYLVNYKLVFRSKASVLRSATAYFLLAAVQLLVSGNLVTLIVQRLHCSETPVKIVVDAAIFIVNYCIQRKVFRRKSAEKGSPNC